MTDASGAAVPKATLTATNVATGVSSTTTSNAAGAYTISQLGEGVYTLKAEASGFREFVVQNLKLASGAVRRLDVLLQLRSASHSSSTYGPASGPFHRGNRTSPAAQRCEPAGYGSCLCTDSIKLPSLC
ncbi:MAG: carboxypeptidase-like regulatory domain-containing protein [Acidobacteriota bacterium]